MENRLIGRSVRLPPRPSKAEIDATADEISERPYLIIDSDHVFAYVPLSTGSVNKSLCIIFVQMMCAPALYLGQ